MKLTTLRVHEKRQSIFSVMVEGGPGPNSTDWGAMAPPGPPGCYSPVRYTSVAELVNESGTLETWSRFTAEYQ